MTGSAASGSWVALLLCAALLCGCTIAGPRTIGSGRIAYNEAIAETGSEQMLTALVRSRYGRQTSLLSVASVTANVRITAGSSIQLRFGDGDNYDGNLVPLTAHAIYEENPTISYVPVAGQRYISQLTTPVGMQVLASLSAAYFDPEPVFRVLIASVNGIRNPDFLFPGNEADPRFDRLVEILSSLTRRQRLHWVEDPDHPERYSMVIETGDAATFEQAGELISLLGLDGPSREERPLVLPVSLAIDGRPTGGVGILTRSVMRLAELLAAAVEVPADDLAAGTTLVYPPLGPAGQGLRVRAAASRPAGAAVAVPHGDHWFYIDDDDLATKGYFRLLTALWSVSIAESTSGTPGPVLTVPVSR
ncbi:MAG: hypothetical protein AB7I04_10035 [Pseudomonadales bacterium]